MRRRNLSFCVLAALVASLWAHAPVAAAQTGSAFEDVAGGAYYAEPVVALAARGVFEGTLCTEGFCPDEPIDRKTMAVWVVRVLDGSDPPAVSQSRFGDVDAGSFHAPFVERLHQLGVTNGCGDGSGYCPHDNVIRAQMAVFLARAFKLPDGPDPGFADVPTDAWYVAEVARLAASGITRGCGEGSDFCPSQETTRGEMATFLWRGQNLDKQQQAPGQYTAISVGDQNVCAIRTDSAIACWGPDWKGSVSDAPEGQFTAVSAGASHACAIRTDRTLVCWGDDSGGALDVPNGQFTAIAAAYFDGGCAIRTDKTVACWGRLGEYGTDAALNNQGGRFTAISARGGDDVCGLRADNSVVCFRVSTHLHVDTVSPVYVRQGRFTSIDGACGLSVDRTAVCSADVDSRGEFTAISEFGGDFCGIRIDGTIYCATPHGPLSRPVFYPLDYAPDGAFTDVSVGPNGACGIRTDKTAVCWGVNWSSEDHSLPGGVQVALPPPWNTAEIWAAEDQMAGLVNELRRSLGLAPLTVYKELRTVARAWSVTMRDRGYFEHNPNFTSYYPHGWTRAGENIAFNSASGRTLMDAVQVAFDGLVASPGHYANMTSPDFNSLGVGVALEGSSFWFTQNFAHYP